MSGTNWYKTDNVAKVFLATFNRRDTRSLRISCTLFEDVDPELLSVALSETNRVRPQFQVRIRRGIFWHYIETTDKEQKVLEENGRPCPILYGSEYKGVLHYQVSYFRNRINLDLFHALSDGTGALEYMNVLVAEYLRLKYPEKLKNINIGSGASAGDLSQDSFEQFYDKDNTDGHLIPKTQGSDKKNKKAYHIHSKKLPYDQLQFLEVKMSAKAIKDESKKIGVGMSAFLAAKFMMAMYKDMPILKRKLPITISMPVNLRNFYPSETARNFFNSFKISHVFTGDETLEELAKEFDMKLKESLKPEKVRQQMDNYQKLERLIFVRMVPLAIKQPVVKIGSRSENKSISMVLSNLGRLEPTEELRPYIKEYSAFCSHDEMFVTAYSYGDDFTLGITYGFTGTSVLKNFVRSLTKDGIEVTINATEVVR